MSAAHMHWNDFFGKNMKLIQLHKIDQYQAGEGEDRDFYGIYSWYLQIILRNKLETIDYGEEMLPIEVRVALCIKCTNFGT